LKGICCAMIQTPSQPRLSVVVCTYDRYDALPNAVDSLLRQRLEVGCLEVIVVDNSPDQENAARFGTRFAHEPGARYLLEPTPGLSNARNVGVAHARADLVAFVDDDAIAAPDWAAHILRAFEAFGGRAGVVGGRVLPRWISPQPPWLTDDLLGYLSIVDWGGQTRPLRSHEWLVGCNIAFDKQILSSVGGFSRALGRVGAGLALLSNEEIEVIEKIQTAGYVPIYCPDALLYHVIDPSRLTRTWFRRRSAWQAISDFMKSPERMTAYSPAAVEHLRRELLDPSRGPTAGFFAATDDPRQFKRDAGLTYDLVVALLAGGAELDGAGRLARPVPLASKLKARVRAAAQASPTFRQVLHYAMRTILRGPLVRKVLRL
jgi:glucosyl-dolichyl phosphate glucuronosyltransferase